MRSNYYIEAGGILAYIKAYGRCAITSQPFNDEATVCAVLLSNKSDWPLPVWGDYSLGTNARQVAFIIKPTAPVLLGAITEATQCDGRTIHFHPVTFKTEEANETAILHEV